MQLALFLSGTILLTLRLSRDWYRPAPLIPAASSSSSLARSTAPPQQHVLAAVTATIPHSNSGVVRSTVLPQPPLSAAVAEGHGGLGSGVDAAHTAVSGATTTSHEAPICRSAGAVRPHTDIGGNDLDLPSSHATSNALRGGDTNPMVATSAKQCCYQCSAVSQCHAWVFVRTTSKCWLKSGGSAHSDSCCDSGTLDPAGADRAVAAPPAPPSSIGGTQMSSPFSTAGMAAPRPSDLVMAEAQVAPRGA